MKRNSNEGQDDPYTSKTGVLLNRLGITTTALLNKVEGQIAASRIAMLRNDPVPGNFDLKHLQSIHRHIFKDTFQWAGKLRTVDISKGGNLFARNEFLEKEGNKLFSQLAKESHLKNLDNAAFAQRAGHYLSEINNLHPFREGNGRASRAFINEVARGTGREIEWEGAGRAAMTQASIEGFHGDSSSMAKLILHNLRDTIDGPSLAERQRTPAVNASIALMNEAQQLKHNGDGTTAAKLEKTARHVAATIGMSENYQTNPFSEKSEPSLFQQFEQGRSERGSINKQKDKPRGKDGMDL